MRHVQEVSTALEKAVEKAQAALTDHARFDIDADSWDIHVGNLMQAILDAADALDVEALRALAKTGASLAHLNETGIVTRHNGNLWQCEAERCVKGRRLAWSPEDVAAKEAEYRAIRAEQKS